jgi:DNA-directed DNA polymerase III PolC
MIRYAKRNGVLVGPSRGSSAGSLVCYLLDITEINPIKHNLLFERFIDLNRDDLPDIDIDFPDDKRQLVIDYLIKKYGENCVAALANINNYQGKSAISDFAQCLGIPKYETDAVKGAIIVRSGGDARADSKISDTFSDTDAGREFISKFPIMEIVSKVEGHASHAGKHAAGIIVSNKPLTTFGAINSRDGIIMMNKKSAEYINLLKIDVLGLRTLTILAEVCKMIKMPVSDLYTLPLEDSKTYDLFQNMRLTGIFQFDGPSLRNIVKQIGASNFNDLALITALSRPGALNSGGTGRYIEYKTGRKQPVYFSELHKQITQDSLGVVVYQEQMMQITKLIGNLCWEDVNSLRQASSRSMGDAYFSKFKDKFIEGAMATETRENAESLWHDISSAGSWLFNKSHAVGYGIVSYWTAYFKANYPLEFAAANLNHLSDESSGVKLLRDFYENDGIRYKPIDPDKSGVHWTIRNGELLGGLTNLEGVQEKTAKKIIADRKTGKLTPAIVKKLMNPVTAYDDLFPCRTRFGRMYNDYQGEGLSRKPNFIRDVTGKDNYIIIGKVVQRDIRDRNDAQSLVRRSGQHVQGNSMYLRLIIEDDTDSIICLIGHKDYIRLEGAELSEKLIVDKTYVRITGSIKSDWRTIAINKIEVLE